MRVHRSFHQTSMQPGTIRTLSFRPGLRVADPRIVLEERCGPRQPVTLLRGLLLVSIQFAGEEQLIAGARLPASEWDSWLVRLPALAAGDELRVTFVNPLGMPPVCFRCWFGDGIQ